MVGLASRINMTIKNTKIGLIILRTTQYVVTSNYGAFIPCQGLV